MYRCRIVTKVYSYNGQDYKQRTLLSETEGFILASTVSSAILSPLAYIGKPFINQLRKDEINNHIYKDCFEKALSISELDKKGVKIIPAQNTAFGTPFYNGTNACFIPRTKEVLINTDKISIAGFHELGHAMNALKSKFGV